MGAPVAITLAQTIADFAQARVLFAEYAASLRIDLSFQDFDGEQQSLSSMYGAPSGCLLLARRAGADIGCVGVRSLSGRDCEMKRLYVREVTRGSGLGRLLAQAAIDWARAAGYRRICLDTLGDMRAAQRLYASLGFLPIDPYYRTPLSGTLFMGLELK